MYLPIFGVILSERLKYHLQRHIAFYFIYVYSYNTVTTSTSTATICNIGTQLNPFDKSMKIHADMSLSVKKIEPP